MSADSIGFDAKQMKKTDHLQKVERNKATFKERQKRPDKPLYVPRALRREQQKMAPFQSKTFSELDASNPDYISSGECRFSTSSLQSGINAVHKKQVDDFNKVTQSSRQSKIDRQTSLSQESTTDASDNDHEMAHIVVQHMKLDKGLPRKEVSSYNKNLLSWKSMSSENVKNETSTSEDNFETSNGNLLFQSLQEKSLKYPDKYMCNNAVTQSISEMANNTQTSELTNILMMPANHSIKAVQLSSRMAKINNQASKPNIYTPQEQIQSVDDSVKMTLSANEVRNFSEVENLKNSVKTNFNINSSNELELPLDVTTETENLRNFEAVILSEKSDFADGTPDIECSQNTCVKKTSFKYVNNCNEMAPACSKTNFSIVPSEPLDNISEAQKICSKEVSLHVEENESETVAKFKTSLPRNSLEMAFETPAFENLQKAYVKLQPPNYVDDFSDSQKSRNEEKNSIETEKPDKCTAKKQKISKCEVINLSVKESILNDSLELETKSLQDTESFIDNIAVEHSGENLAQNVLTNEFDSSYNQNDVFVSSINSGGLIREDLLKAPNQLLEGEQDNSQNCKLEGFNVSQNTAGNFSQPNEKTSQNCQMERSLHLSQTHTSTTDFLKEKSNESWETMFSDDGECLLPETVKELCDITGRIQVHVAKNSYSECQPLSNSALEEYENIVELYGFPIEFNTQDLVSAFSLFEKSSYTIKWVDDCHALAVFSSPAIANQALLLKHPFLKVRPLSEGIAESKAKARSFAKIEESHRPRPVTSAVLARRLVSGALGLKVHTSKEQRDIEKKLLREAKERKRSKAKQKQDIWDGIVS